MSELFENVLEMLTMVFKWTVSDPLLAFLIYGPMAASIVFGFIRIFVRKK